MCICQTFGRHALVVETAGKSGFFTITTLETLGSSGFAFSVPTYRLRGIFALSIGFTSSICFAATIQAEWFGGIFAVGVTDTSSGICLALSLNTHWVVGVFAITIILALRGAGFTSSIFTERAQRILAITVSKAFGGNRVANSINTFGFAGVGTLAV